MLGPSIHLRHCPSSAFSGSKVVLQCPIHASCSAVSATTKSFESSSSSGFVHSGGSVVLHVSSIRPSPTKSEFSLVVAEYQRRLIAQCTADQCQTSMFARRPAPALSKKNSENPLVIRQYPATRPADCFHHRVALPVPEIIHVLSTICHGSATEPNASCQCPTNFIVFWLSAVHGSLFLVPAAQHCHGPEGVFFLWIRLVSITSPRHFLSCSALVRTAATLHVLYQRTLPLSSIQLHSEEAADRVRPPWRRCWW